MTTQNIPNAAQAAGTLANLGQNTRKRQTAVEEQLGQLEERERDILLGASTAVQVVRDEQTGLREELDQFDQITARAASLSQPAPAPVAVPPAEPVAAPAAELPTAELPAVPPPAAEPEAPSNGERAHQHFNPRQWRGLGWLFAAVGVIIGILIAALWDGDEWVRAQADNGFEQVLGAIATVLWWLGWPLLIGGLLGALGDWLEKRPRNQDE